MNGNFVVKGQSSDRCLWMEGQPMKPCGAPVPYIMGRDPETGEKCRLYRRGGLCNEHQMKAHEQDREEEE